jgi:hypothetical protein
MLSAVFLSDLGFAVLSLIIPAERSMNLYRLWSVALLVVLALPLFTTRNDGQERPVEQERSGAGKPAAKADPAAIARLIAQLGSDSFKTRERASQQLAQLDEVPEALRDATKHADPEVANRAQVAVDRITAHASERLFRAKVRDLQKVELDQLVRSIVTEPNSAGERQWQVLQVAATAVTKEANRLAGRQLALPEFPVNNMPRLFFHNESRNPVRVNRSVLLSAGPTPHITGVTDSLVIVDGDFRSATGVDGSVLIVRGNVGHITAISNSIILATGHWEGATSCRGCFIQVKNQRLEIASAEDNVLVKSVLVAEGDTNNRTLNIATGPLQLLRFGPQGR